MTARRALIAGLGSIGSRHLNNLHSLGLEEFLVYRSRNAPPPKELTAKNIRSFSNLEEALEGGPDLAVIANPSSLHTEVTRACVEKGVPVYLEKPIAHQWKGPEQELDRLLTEKKIVLLVGCQLRFHESLQFIASLLEKEKLGNIYSVRADVGEHLPSWHPWEDYRESYAARVEMGGGVILTLIHELDYLRWFFGPVQRVYAQGGSLSQLGIEAEDTALITLTTRSKIPIQLRMDYTRQPPRRTLDIVAEGGEIHWDYHRGIVEWREGEKIVASHHLAESWERNHLFLDAMKHFLELREGGVTNRCDWDAGKAALELALAARCSLETHEVVELEETPFAAQSQGVQV